MALKVTTNNVPRDVIYGYELTDEERAEFDYIDWQAAENGESSPEFFRYRGQLYDLWEFQRVPSLSELAGWDGVHEEVVWDGYLADSFFSGIVIRYVEDFERVVVGTYYAS